MTTTPAPTRVENQELPLPTRTADLVPGLLLFFSRPSALQSWAELFGHEWRHVGVTVRTKEGLRVASYGPRKCFRLDDPAALMPAYDRVGVARIFETDTEVESVERFCRAFEHLERSDSPYTFSSILLGPIHLAARRRDPGFARSVMFAIVSLYCLFQRSRYRDRKAYLCSTFVWAAISEARSDPLRIPLSSHPEDLAAYATASTARDERFARWLCGPTELWQAISPTSRSEIDLSRLDDAPRATGNLACTWGEEFASSETEVKRPAVLAPRRSRVPHLAATARVAALLRVANLATGRLLVPREPAMAPGS